MVDGCGGGGRCGGDNANEMIVVVAMIRTVGDGVMVVIILRYSGLPVDQEKYVCKCVVVYLNVYAFCLRKLE